MLRNGVDRVKEVRLEAYLNRGAHREFAVFQSHVQFKV